MDKKNRNQTVRPLQTLADTDWKNWGQVKAEISQYITKRMRCAINIFDTQMYSYLICSIFR